MDNQAEQIVGTIRILKEGGLFKVTKFLGKIRHGSVHGEFFEIRYLDDGSKQKFSRPFVEKCKETTQEDLDEFLKNQTGKSAWEKENEFKIN
jgi:hypothetical protein